MRASFVQQRRLGKVQYPLQARLALSPQDYIKPAMCYVSTTFFTRCSHYSRRPRVLNEPCARASTASERAHGCWERVDMGIDSVDHQLCRQCERDGIPRGLGIFVPDHGSHKPAGRTPHCDADRKNPFSDHCDSVAHALTVLSYLPAALQTQTRAMQRVDSALSMASLTMSASTALSDSASRRSSSAPTPPSRFVDMDDDRHGVTPSLEPSPQLSPKPPAANMHWRAFDQMRYTEGL